MVIGAAERVVWNVAGGSLQQSSRRHKGQGNRNRTLPQIGYSPFKMLYGSATDAT
jgi:hypothetical protein